MSDIPEICLRTYLETLSHVSTHSSTSLAMAIDSIIIAARYFDLQVRYSMMIQPCFRDCKHTEVVERTYNKTRDLIDVIVVVLATCRALFSRLNYQDMDLLQCRVLI